MEDSSHLPKVCIIGAGPSGLLALRHFKGVADLTCYDLKSGLGGLWAYDSVTDSSCPEDDPYQKQYGTVHQSIYQDLTTIVPIHFFAFKDFPPKVGKREHFTPGEVLEYLQGYADKFELHQYLCLNTLVDSVTQEDQNWKVTVTKDNTTTEVIYDFVIICNGHNSVPFFPPEPTPGIENYEGTVMHAHNFRKPDCEEFSNKSILIIGANYSGMDILYQLLEIKNIRGRIQGCDQVLPLSESGVGCAKIILASSKGEEVVNSDDFRPFVDLGILKGKSKVPYTLTKDSV